MPVFRKGDEPVLGYRLEQFLGRGQFGDVWLAIAPGKLRVALKFIDLSGKQGLKEFKGVQRVREIRHPHLMSITALWMLDHDGNVLSDDVIDELEAQAMGKRTDVKGTLDISFGQPALMVVAMPLGEKSLLDILESEGPAAFSTDELLNYMEEAAKGIDYLNSPKHDLGDGRRVGIQHCDIKPANIMIMGDSALVCDFGLARVLTFGADVRATTTGMAGTPAYMAPECIEGKLPSDSTDQYSLAITYYELRTGKLPFEEESQTSQMAILTAHVKGKLDYSRLPPEEQEVIRKATSLDPAARWPSCLTMVRELRKVVGSVDHLSHSSDSDWTSSKASGAPSGSSVFETNVDPGSGKKSTGSYHETLDPEQAAASQRALSESQALEKSARPAIEAEPARPATNYNQTLMPSDLAQPVDSRYERRERETVREIEVDTHRDSVREEALPSYRPRPKRGFPWGGLTTAVAVMALAVVVLYNVRPDLFAAGGRSRVTLESLAAAGRSASGLPSVVNPPPPPPPPPPPEEEWAVQLEQLLSEQEFLAACRMFQADGQDPTIPATDGQEHTIPATDVEFAADRILTEWKAAAAGMPPAEADAADLAVAAGQIPLVTGESKAGELRSHVVGLLRTQVAADLQAMSQRFEAEDIPSVEESQQIAAEIERLIPPMALIEPVDERRRQRVAAHLLHVRAKLRQLPDDQLLASWSETAEDDMVALEIISNWRDMVAADPAQSATVRLLEFVPTFAADRPLDGLKQLKQLTSGREGSPAPEFRPWEKTVINTMKERIREPLNAMAVAGTLTDLDRALADDVGIKLDDVDYFARLVAHLNVIEGEEDAFYTQLETLANHCLSSDVKEGSLQWALATCCLYEASLRKLEGPNGDGFFPIAQGRPQGWYQIQGNMKKAQAALEGSEYVPYGQFVSAIVGFFSSKLEERKAASELMAAAFRNPPPVLEASFRRRTGADILSRSLADLLPTDIQAFAKEGTAAQGDFITATDWENALDNLQSSRSLHGELSSHGNMYAVIIYGNRPQSTQQELSEAAAAAKAFDDRSDASNLLASSGRKILYSMSKGKVFDRLSKIDSASPSARQHAAAAIPAYAAAARDLWNMREAMRKAWRNHGDRLIDSAVIYDHIVNPAIALDLITPKTIESAAPALKQDLAFAHFVKGELIRTDPVFAADAGFRTDDKPRGHHQAAMEAYARAAELDPKIEYLTNQGHQLRQAKVGNTKLPDELAALVAKIDPDKVPAAAADPQALRLRAKLCMIQGRLASDDTLPRLAKQADDDIQKALSLIDNTDELWPELVVDKAAALVVLAYTQQAPEKKKSLDEAIKLAKDIADNFPNRHYPAEAFNTIGNANEDLSFYLGEDKWTEAIGNFQQAVSATSGVQFGVENTAELDDKRYLTMGKSYMNWGRCELRYAQFLARTSPTDANALYASARIRLEKAIENLKHDKISLAESHYLAGMSRMLPNSNDALLAEAENHFQQAKEIAQANGDKEWYGYELFRAECMVNRALLAPKDLKETLRENATNAIKRLLEPPPDGLLEELKAFHIHKAIDDCTFVLAGTYGPPESFVRMRTELDRGIELLAKSPRSEPEFEADLRLKRCELIASLAIQKLSLSAGEKRVIDGDLKFVRSVKSDKFNRVKRLDLMLGLEAGLSATDDKGRVNAETLLVKGIKGFGDEISDVTLAARLIHMNIARHLVASGEIPSAAKKRIASDSEEFWEPVRQSPRFSGIAERYKAQLDEIKAAG